MKREGVTGLVFDKCLNILGGMLVLDDEAQMKIEMQTKIAVSLHGNRQRIQRRRGETA